jgi:hypothetical protein
VCTARKHFGPNFIFVSKSKKALLTNLYLYNVKTNIVAYYTSVQICEEKGFKDGPNTLAYWTKVKITVDMAGPKTLAHFQGLKL